MKSSLVALSLLLGVAPACSSSSEDGDKPNGSGAGASTGGSSVQSVGGSANPGAGGTSNNPAGGSSVGATTSVGGTGQVFVGTECPADLGLPSAEILPNVLGIVNGGTAKISFDPRKDAKDYRVYVLPAASDVSGDVVTNATYRCAGQYEVPFPAQDDSTIPDSPAVRTTVNGTVQGYARTAADATLGYVFTTPAEDRLPVYVLGDSDPKADNTQCYFMRWPESRVKKYTTSEDERSQLIADHWRDDGIAFYVPKPDAAGVTPVYEAADTTNSDWDGTLYVVGDEYTTRAGDGNKAVTAAFSVFPTAQAGTEPLMRVYYGQACARGHDELVATEARFNKAFAQGASPVQKLHFSGITAETTLVVEAIDALCPHPGIVSPRSRPARDDPFGDYSLHYPQFLTPDEVRAASPTGEVFINGQGPAIAPHAVARACVTVSPTELPEMDWRYDGGVEDYTEAENTGFQMWMMESDTFDFHIHTVATDEWGIGSMFGELWLTWSDWAADTNGKMRITPKTNGTFAADSYLRATMQVDIVSSDRRYPQLIISDQNHPVQDNLVNGSTVVIQTRGGITSPMEVQMQFCDHRNWDVNDQCPQWETYLLSDGAFLSPRPEINGFMASDETVLFDAFVSTGRVYLFTNGLPYACADLPEGKLPAGSASVTFGDVLYHSGVDLAEWYPYHVSRMQMITSRHFSNLAFSSGVTQPTWDEARIPCAPASTLH